MLYLFWRKPAGAPMAPENPGRERSSELKASAMPANEPAPRPYDHVFVLLATIIWASTYVNIKLVLPSIPPNTLAFSRFLLASLAFAAFFVVTGFPRIARQDWPRILFCGLTGVTLYNFLQNQGMKTAGTTDAAILASMAPIFIALLAWLFLKEQLSAKKIIGILLAFSGAVLIAGNGSFGGVAASPERVIGDGLVLLTGLCWAAYSIALKGLLKKYSATTVLAYSTFAGTLFLAPLAAWEPPVSWGALSLDVWANLFYLGLLASALAYWFWNTALERVPAASAGAYLYLLPVFTALIAALWLGELPGPYIVAGGALALLGTYLASG